MTTYDLCIAWNWEYDADFIALLDQVCRERQVSLLHINPENLAFWQHALRDQRISIRTFLDRASESDPHFMPLASWVEEHQIYSINPHARAHHSADKASMHLALMDAGLYVPYTIILQPYTEQPDLPVMDLGMISERFIIKPAHGSGGEGVMTRATTWQQVLAARQEHAHDRYLLQDRIIPRQMDSRLAWFRVIYCTGEVYPCWWHPHTHMYDPVTKTDNDHYGLTPLMDMTRTLARVCGLDLFSTEIAYTPEGLFVVVDYINDPIDLRIRSRMHDGLPDEIAKDIADRLVSRVLEHR